MTNLARGADRLATTTTATSSLVVSADKALLFDVWGYSTADQYIQVHDAVSVATATTPIAIIRVLADQHFSFSVAGGIPCNTGIVVCNSSTAATLTIGGNTCMFSCGYKMF